MQIFVHITLYQSGERSYGKTQQVNRRKGRERKKEGGRNSGKFLRETTGGSETWETRIA